MTRVVLDNHCGAVIWVWALNNAFIKHITSWWIGIQLLERYMFYLKGKEMDNQQLQFFQVVNYLYKLTIFFLIKFFISVFCLWIFYYFID